MGRLKTFQSMTVAALALPALLFSFDSLATQKKLCQAVNPTTYLCNKLGLSGIATVNGTCMLATLSVSTSTSCGGASTKNKYDIALGDLSTTAMTQGCVCTVKKSGVASKNSGSKATAAKKPAAAAPDATAAVTNAATTGKSILGGNPAGPAAGTTSTLNVNINNGSEAKSGKEVWKDSKGNVLGTKETFSKNGEETVRYYDTTGKWKSSETTSANVDTSDETSYSFSKGNKRFSYGSAEEAKQAAAEQGSGTITVNRNGTKVVVDAATGQAVKKTSSQGTDGLRDDERKEALADECSDAQIIALKLNKKDGGTRDFRCNATNTMVKGVTIGNQILQTAGSTVINTIGNQVAANAQNGTASSLQKGVAKAAKTAADYQTVVGVLNAAATVKLMQKTAQHKRAAAEIREYQDSQQAEIDSHNYLNSAGGSGPEVAALNASRAQKALDQQQGARKSAAEATMAAITGFATAAMQVTNAKIAQKGAEKAARNYQNLEATMKQTGVLWDTSGPTAAVVNDATNSAATSGSSQSVSETANEEGGGTSLLGDGKDLGAGGGEAAPLTPGEFKAAAGGSSGGGSGGGMGGGAPSSGGAPSANPEDPKAAYASAFDTKERYESGGGPAGAKGAGGGKGGKDDGIGIDMGAFAALLNPKSLEDTVKENEQGILAYGKGGVRAPASADENGSYLDKNADLFQRIHETMSEKHRRGQVGI